VSGLFDVPRGQLPAARLDKTGGPDPDMKSGDYVMIAVTDTGIGIPKAIREKVFELFDQEARQGAGLMAYGFVTQSKGHLKIDDLLFRNRNRTTTPLPGSPTVAPAFFAI
jgi:hypothetical protein